MVGVGSASHCVCEHDWWWRCLVPYSLGRRGLSQTLWWRERQLKALLWPLFAWSAWTQLPIVVAGATEECAALSSVRFVGVGSASHCVSGNDR
jgi:hypothetical protein